MKKFKITYPVAMDNDFATWTQYANRYWPAHYLIDRSGHIVETHFGEGAYEETEARIRKELGLAGAAPTGELEKAAMVGQTPETYLGSARAERFASPEELAHSRTYSFPTGLQLNEWALQGAWKTNADEIVSSAAGATMRLHFNAGIGK